MTYPEATHGWNQSSQSFFTEIGCKGRGCINRNLFNKEVTEASTKDIVRFLSDKTATGSTVTSAPGPSACCPEFSLPLKGAL